MNIIIMTKEMRITPRMLEKFLLQVKVKVKVRVKVQGKFSQLGHHDLMTESLMTMTEPHFQQEEIRGLQKSAVKKKKKS